MARGPSTDERLELAAEIKEQIQLQNPDLSAAEAERRAFQAAGLGTGLTPTEGRKRQEAPRRRRAPQIGKGARNVTGAKRTILLVATVVLIVGVVRDVRTGRAFTSDALARRLFGTFVAAFMLILISGPAPGLAKGFALVMGAGAILLDGGAIFQTIGQATGEPVSPSLNGNRTPAPETRSPIPNRPGVI